MRRVATGLPSSPRSATAEAGTSGLHSREARRNGQVRATHTGLDTWLCRIGTRGIVSCQGDRVGNALGHPTVERLGLDVGLERTVVPPPSDSRAMMVPAGWSANVVNLPDVDFDSITRLNLEPIAMPWSTR